jgi:hypothetical protein
VARYRDTVTRCSLAQLRASYSPRAYRALTTVRLECAGLECEVEIVRRGTPGCLAAERRWFVCPRCGEPAAVLGCVEEFGWGCRACCGWRSRNQRPIAR